MFTTALALLFSLKLFLKTNFYAPTVTIKMKMMFQVKIALLIEKILKAQRNQSANFEGLVKSAQLSQCRTIKNFKAHQHNFCNYGSCALPTSIKS